MQNEFAVAGIDIHIVSINTESGLDSAQKLVDMCAFRFCKTPPTLTFGAFSRVKKTICLSWTHRARS